MKLALLTKYALKGIRRGGQRVLLAVLAVAFGVMSLVAMAGRHRRRRPPVARGLPDRRAG